MNVITLDHVDAEGEARRSKLNLTSVSEDLYNHAVHLKSAGKYAAATIAMRRVVAVSPDSGIAWSGLGSLLWNIGQYDAALKALNHAVHLLPNDSTPLGNLGQVLSSLGDKEKALASLKRACELRPDDKHVQWNYAVALLDHGEWDQGFREYECRFEHRGTQYYPKMPYPMWNGEDLNNKTLFLQAEQGVGDRILFSRYIGWIKQRWPHARILFLCTSPDQIQLETLFWGFRDAYGVEFLPPGIPWPDADYGCWLVSLPRIHGSKPEDVPADPGVIRKRCAAIASGGVAIPEPHAPALKVGVAWTGNPAMLRNNDRSIPLELILELQANPNVQLYGLQFGNNDIERLGAEQLICDLTPHIRDAAQTGAAMLELDLVITACTSTAHIGGAVGVPTWVALCADPYWVWLRDRDDCPWYPTVRLFRQQKPNDWRPVIERMKTELAALAQRKLSPKQPIAAAAA